MTSLQERAATTHAMMTTTITTTSSNEEEALDEDPLSPAFRVGSFVTYSAIFLMGLVGNVLFSYIVISSRSMKNMTYHLLVNLSVSDLLVTCLCGPLHVLCSLVLGYWPFGALMCYTFSYAQSISVLLSSYTLVVISFERYMSILHPLKPLLPRSGSRYVILGLWIFAMLASVPTPLQTKHFSTPDGFYQCATEDDLFFHVSNVVLMVVQYFLPVLLMSIFYWLVARTIWARRDICELIDSTQHTRINKELQMLRSRRKMIKMLLVVVFCYTICWLPFNIYWVIGLAIPSHMNPYIFTIVHIMAVSHTCLNPIIYCWMNRRVRYGFMDIVGQLESVRRCFPSVDWESTGLTRHARQTQFTVLRKNNGGNNNGNNESNNESNKESNRLLNKWDRSASAPQFTRSEHHQSVGHRIRLLKRQQKEQMEMKSMEKVDADIQHPTINKNGGKGNSIEEPPSVSETENASNLQPEMDPMQETKKRVEAKASLSAAGNRPGHKVSVVSTVTNLSFVSNDSRDNHDHNDAIDDNDKFDDGEERVCKERKFGTARIIRSVSEFEDSTDDQPC